MQAQRRRPQLAPGHLPERRWRLPGRSSTCSSASRPRCTRTGSRMPLLRRCPPPRWPALCRARAAQGQGPRRRSCQTTSPRPCGPTRRRCSPLHIRGRTPLGGRRLRRVQRTASARGRCHPHRRLRRRPLSASTVPMPTWHGARGALRDRPQWSRPGCKPHNPAVRQRSWRAPRCGKALCLGPGRTHVSMPACARPACVGGPPLPGHGRAARGAAARSPGSGKSRHPLGAPRRRGSRAPSVRPAAGA
mmetsp:Transcript_111063/g.358565  ORF Transcript_111063/g.358565 Transcript_111063/m.358565 type:complete len:247 (-) Transcript_111063:829-1569(-)